jgi:hypothetical protein
MGKVNESNEKLALTCSGPNNKTELAFKGKSGNAFADVSLLVAF